MTLVVAQATSDSWTRATPREMDPEIHSTASTPTPPMPGTTSRDLTEAAVVKDEHGQDIVCVVCSDKSSGKHYGQFTCEGESQQPIMSPHHCQPHSTKLN